LTGRRMRDVNEEQKLRDWISKKAEREREKERRREEKYEQLKRGPPKHQLSDTSFERTRDEILEKTEDAIEQGLSALNSEAKADKRRSSAAPADHEDDDDQDTPGVSGWKVKKPQNRQRTVATSPLPSKPAEKAQKRPAAQTTPELEHQQPPLKHSKIGHGQKTSAAVVATSAAATSEKPPVVAQTKKSSSKKSTSKAKAIDNQSSEETTAETNKAKATVEYAAIELTQIKDSVELEAFGLEHLKVELQRRGLKCGGSLQERAERLFSVRLLAPAKYPKKLLAVK